MNSAKEAVKDDGMLGAKRKREADVASEESSLLGRWSANGMYTGIDGEQREMTVFEKIAEAAGIPANINRLNKEALVQQLTGRGIPGMTVDTLKKEMQTRLREIMEDQGVTGVLYLPISEDVKKGDPEWILTPEQKDRLAEINAFVDEFGMGKLNRKKKRYLLECARKQFDSFKLGTIVSHSCKKMDLTGAFDTYKQYRDIGVYPSFDDFCNLLSLVAGLGEQGSSAAPTREVEPPQDVTACSEVFEDLRGEGHKLNENIYTAVIRCLSMNDRQDRALELYKEMQQKEIVPKGRTFTHLLGAYSLCGNKAVCFDLYRDITERYEMIPAERDYVNMLKVCATNDDSRFYDVLEAFMEDVLVPEKREDTWQVLREWFSAAERGFIVRESPIDSISGSIECNQETLRSIDLNTDTRKQLLSQINRLASDRNQAVLSASAAQVPSGDIVLGGGKGKLTKSRLEDLQKRHSDTMAKWEAYIAWMAEVLSETQLQVRGDGGGHGGCDTSTKTPSMAEVTEALKGEESMGQNATYKYDVIIDGANLGYYKQAYQGAPTHVDYNQIDWAVRQLQIQGYHPLVVLHRRHIDNKKIPAEAKVVIHSWITEKLLYQTPHGCNDDWFWLHMAVVLRAKLLTNDEMRDHNFQMLSPRCFGRWKERNQIRFSFGGWVPKPAPDPQAQTQTQTRRADESQQTHWRQALLSIPPRFSYRMQCLSPRRSYAFPARDSGAWLSVYKKDDR